MFHPVNIVLFVVLYGVLYMLFPAFLHFIVYDIVLRKSVYLLPFVVIMLWFVKRYTSPTFHRRDVSVVVTNCVIAILFGLCVNDTSNFVTYKLYADEYSKIDKLLVSDPKFVRYTPFENACTDLGNSISSSGEHIECKYVRTIVTPNGFGYVGAILPSGVLNTFVQQNPGYMFLDDSPEADSDPSKRIVRIDDSQKIGQGMEWFDGLQYNLLHTDFFAKYDTPHFLVLDSAKPNKYTMVVPKIKYGYLFRVPFWAGVVLVHSDGRIEDLDVKSASSDPRLSGKWIYPLSLARTYIEFQNYGVGWGIISPYVRVANKLEIEKLPGSNQFPFLTRTMDGKTYFVTATKGEGTARGLFRMYYIDASSGEGWYHEFGKHEVIYGADASLDRVTNIPNYQWKHSDSNAGTMEGIEPVYIVRPSDPTLYWKFTITNEKRSGISATVVVESVRPDQYILFRKRSDFETWLQGSNVNKADIPSESEKKTILRVIGELEQRVNQLRTAVEAMPDR